MTPIFFYRKNVVRKRLQFFSTEKSRSEETPIFFLQKKSRSGEGLIFSMEKIRPCEAPFFSYEKSRSGEALIFFLCKKVVPMPTLRLLQFSSIEKSSRDEIPFFL